MSSQQPSQLDKILALADSSHDGEAVVAVRKARQVLMQRGLSFGDLARAAAQKQRRGLPMPFFMTPSVELEIENNELRQQLCATRNDLQMRSAEAELWRQRAAELEQKLIASQAETRRWRQMARDTVEKMWDLGQTMHEDEFTSLADEPEAKSA